MRSVFALLILLFLATALWAHPVSVGLGSTFLFGNQYEDIEMGGEMRISYYLFESTLASVLRRERLTTLMAGGLAYTIMGVARVSLAMGPVVQLDYRDVFFDWRYMDSSYHYTSVESFSEAYYNGLINYRAYVEAILFPLSLSLTYQVPTLSASFANFKEGDFSPVWERGLWGLTLCYWLL